MRNIIIFFILFSLISPTYAHLSEVMFNPQEGSEWVELYIESGNLSGLVFADNYAQDSVGCCHENCSMVFNHSFVIISVLGSDADLCVGDKALGNGLGNTGDIINLTFFGQQYDFLQYNSTVPKGMSLSLVNGSWFETEPTPGEENVAAGGICLEFNLPAEVFVNTTYEDIFKVINKDHVAEQGDAINVIVSYTYGNITGNFSVDVNSYTTQGTGIFYVQTPGNYTLCGHVQQSNFSACKVVAVQGLSQCDVSLNTQVGGLYDVGEKVVFTYDLSNESYPYSITYWIEDLFGKVVKSPVKSQNLNPKSFIPDFSSAHEVYIIKGKLEVACNDTDRSDNTDARTIVIRGKREDSPHLAVEEIYLGQDSKIKYGEILRTRLQIYTGNSTKTTVSAWVEDSHGTKLSKITSFNLKEKYSNADITIPIQLLPNCQGKLDEGKHLLKVEGLDQQDIEQVRLEGNLQTLCQEQPDAPQTTSSSVVLPRRVQYTLDEVKVDADKVMVSVSITNIDDEDKEYEVWSYIYLGSATHSGERKENLQQVELSPGKTERLTLHNTADASGSFKLKVMILKAGIKTPYELTRDIVVESSDSSEEEADSRIISFYTRSTRFSSDINLYASVDGADDAYLVLSTYDSTAKLNLTGNPVQIPVTLKEGVNFFQLRLYRDSEMLDSRELVILANSTHLTAYPSLVSLHADGRLSIAEDMFNATQARKADTPTGMSVTEVYRSSSAKAKDLRPFFLIGAVVLAVIAFFSRKSYKPI